MDKVSDVLAGATDNDDDLTVEGAAWIVDESERHCFQSDVMAKANHDKNVLINEERPFAENTSPTQAGSFGVTRSVVNAFDCLPDATGNGGGISVKAAS